MEIKRGKEGIDLRVDVVVTGKSGSEYVNDIIEKVEVKNTEMEVVV